MSAPDRVWGTTPHTEVDELRRALRHAATVLCETRRHRGNRPCDFCLGQIVWPYSKENIAARAALPRKRL